MRYKEISIFEKSKDNKQSVKKYKTSKEEILDRYDGKSENLYVSYTVVKKVGINPRSGYGTPIGIYSYPMKYVIEQIKSNDEVPYMGDTPYIQVFAATGKGVNLETYNELKSDINKLKEYFVNTKSMATEEEFDNIVQEGINTAFKRKNQDASSMWNITRVLSEKVANGELNESKINESTDLLYQDLLEWNDSKPQRAVVVWNGILRNILGYEYADDPGGYKIIHPNEPTQAVFFSTKALKVVDQIKNSSNLDYKLTLISNIGRENPNDPKNRARKAYEYQRLIAKNLNNPNRLTELKIYFKYISSPKLQRQVIERNPGYILQFSKVFNPKVKDLARKNFLKTIQSKNTKKINEMFSSFSDIFSERAKFFDLIGVGNQWPEFESAIIDYFDEQDDPGHDAYDRLSTFTHTYLLNIKPQRWPEFERFITNRFYWEPYKQKFNIADPVIAINDIVKILTGPNKGKTGVIANINLGMFTVADDNRNFLGIYFITQIEKTGDVKKSISNVDTDKFIMMVDNAKKRGYVTHDELIAVMPSSKVSDEDFIDIHDMLVGIGVQVVEEDPEPAEPVKTKGPTGPKIGKFAAQALKKGGDITQAELDKFLPPGTIKTDSLKNILEFLKDEGITVDGKPINVDVDKVTIPKTHSNQFKPYDGDQKLTTKEKNTWEQIMIKSFNDVVVKSLLTKAFKNYSLTSNEFYTLTQNIDFPFWVAGKYLGNAGVKVDVTKAKQEFNKIN